MGKEGGSSGGCGILRSSSGFLVSPKTKAQLSLEALLALAAFLSVLSILIFSAERINSHLQVSCLESSERYSLAYQALSLDTAAGSLPGSRFEHHLHAVPSQDGRRIFSSSNPSVSEKVFHEISADQSGGVYVQENSAEPV